MDLTTSCFLGAAENVGVLDLHHSACLVLWHLLLDAGHCPRKFFAYSDCDWPEPAEYPILEQCVVIVDHQFSPVRSRSCIKYAEIRTGLPDIDLSTDLSNLCTFPCLTNDLLHCQTNREWNYKPPEGSSHSANQQRMRVIIIPLLISDWGGDETCPEYFTGDGRVQAAVRPDAWYKPGRVLLGVWDRSQRPGSL